MQKFMTLLAVAILVSMASFAQQGGPSIEVRAKQLATQAGCLNNGNGQVATQTTVISSCLAGEFVTEVLIVPVCNGLGCENVRLGALAKVTFYCDETNGIVECIGQ